MSENKLAILKKIESRSSKSHIDTGELIGLNSLLIYSKEIFNKNEEIDEFIEEVFGIKFLPYVIRSRTLIFARISREIYYYDDQTRIKTIQNIAQYFHDDLTESQGDSTKGQDDPKKENINKNTGKKSPNANENMKKWMRGLNNSNE